MVGKSGLNFNYEGPPVAVSNGMALDLVSQFGIQNAWFAILKLTGMNVFKEESEKTKALKHFRNKIQRIKKNVENLKSRHDEFNNFLSKEFNQNTISESSSLESTNKEAIASSEESDSGNGILICILTELKFNKQNFSFFIVKMKLI